ncbi:putative neural Wiskott-Aldrich syndrome protein-like isoform X3 [Apostichopus japonicus]|uniref:Putative neural Wiskott-Aldrich syndrome protein-like isoform X3 n=1 Tax=Stichopus japonicus TaxID=307972 RepID=A0A2G8JCC0_STIJA|nr:putative neural Wiskott-Aldrich syndrome protein-like isoform X3 [Apostichopus japonicus]
MANQAKDINASCSLLSPDENEELWSMLGPRCQTEASAIVQLYLTELPDNKKWSMAGTGVACFIKDNRLRSYFIRIYDFQTKSVFWELELYRMFVYHRFEDFFAYFETEVRYLRHV